MSHISCPDSAILIVTVDEARAYYRAKLSGIRKITCYEKMVAIFFEDDATHTFSVEVKDAQARNTLPSDLRVTRRTATFVEVRRLCLDRARHMDQVLPAVSGFIVSTVGHSGNRTLYGPALPDERRMKIVLQAGPGDAYRCLSAFPVAKYAYLDAMRSKRSKFPP